MTTTQQDIEARLSYAYLHAVASHAGFLCRQATPDEDKEGIDATLSLFQHFPNTYITQVTINVQLKATIKRPTESASHLSYFLQGVRRYDELRKDHRTPPRLAVILFLPEKHEDWIDFSEEELALKRCAYWVSLRNAPASVNDSGQTVKIPKTQALSPAALQQLALQIAQGSVPEYLAP